MKQEKMQLTLVASPTMDKWAEKNSAEHNKIRLSKRARKYYEPSDYKNMYINIHGILKEGRLKIGQAAKADIKKTGPKETRTIGFVTAKTYETLMGNKGEKESIWISEGSLPITLGCDPEFVVLRDSGEALYGDAVLGYSFSDPAKKSAKFGSDGPCLELRPDPSNNVEGLVNNIRKLLLEDNTNRNKIINYRWIGGASYRNQNMDRRYPIGGHIHFGLPNIEGGAINPNKMIQNRIARVLTELVGVPLVRIDTPKAGERRTSLGYGKFEDVKNYDHRFEWRTPSGIWLVHPDITYGVLGTSKAVAEECWKKYEDNDCNKDFMLETNSRNNLQKSLGCLETEKVRSLINQSKASDIDSELLNSIHNKLKAMSNYNKYKQEIDTLFNICSKEKLTQNKLFLKRGWLEKKPL